MNDMQRSVMAAIEEALAERRAVARCRRKLRARGLRMTQQGDLWLAFCPLSWSVKRRAYDVADIEAWANQHHLEAGR